MTARNGRLVWQVCNLVGLWCVCLLAAPSVASADGSISFNGGSTGSSKIQNENGNVLNNANTMTICAWVYPIGQGEGGVGMLLGLDKAGNGIRIHRDASSTLAFIAKWSGGDGKWTIPVPSNTWTAVAFTYYSDDDYNDPSARVNFSSATVTQPGANPSGTAINPTAGYCVGNLSGNANTWDGRIAHVQVFNRILSPAEQDACLRDPGSVTSGLRLWLPMLHGTDITDRSVNGFHGTATDLSTGEGGPAVFTHPGGAPIGNTFLTSGILPVTQHVILRFANGVTYPGGQLRGVGPASVIRATADTDDLASDKRGIVITEDYEYASAQWQSDTETTRKAVLQAAVRDLTIAGYDETGTEYATGGLVNNQPNLWNKIKGKITNATLTSPIRITSPYHSLPTGSTLTINGLDTLNNDGVDGSRTVTRLTGSISATSGTNPIVVTSNGHNLTDGSSVLISGVTVNPAANGVKVITYVNSDNFSIPVDGTPGGAGTNGSWESLDIFSINVNYSSGSYTAGTGTWTSNYWNDKYDGLLMRSSGLLVDNVNFFYIPGTTLVVKKGGTGGQSGPKLMFDREKARIWDCKVNRAYKGFWIDDVDTVVGRLEGSDLRDYGIKFGRTVEEGYGGGSTQIDGALHFYGVGTGGTDEPAVWFASGAGPSWGGPIYAENAPVGVQIDSSGNRLTNVYSHTCFFRNVAITGQRNSIENFEIDVYNGITETNGGEAVLVGNQANTLSNGTIGGGVFGAVPSGEIAIRVTNGTRQVLRDISVLGTVGSSAPLISVAYPLRDSVIDARCFSGGTFLDLYRIASGTARGGDTSTILLDARENLGAVHLVVAGVTTTITITGGTGGSSNQTRTITSYDNSTKTATVSATWTVVPDHTSTYVIEGDRLGSNNRIYITADSNTGKDINLDPTGWDKNTNLIVVNGVRVLGSITGATNDNPIVITSAGHEVRNGELVAIDDVQGNTNANGTYYAKYLSADTFSLYTDASLTTGRAGNAAYTANTGYWGKRFNAIDAAGD